MKSGQCAREKRGIMAEEQPLECMRLALATSLLQQKKFKRFFEREGAGVRIRPAGVEEVDNALENGCK